jgi:hypothetical protein
MSHTGPSGEPRRNLPQPPPPSSGWSAPASGRPGEGWSAPAPVRPGESWPAAASGGPQAGPADPVGGEHAAPTDPEPPADPDARRRKLLLIGGGVVALVVLVGVLVAVLTGKDEAGPAPVAETVTLSSPVPTTQPVARTSTTAFAAALPLSVLQFALASSAPEDAWVAAGALEAYTETFAAALPTGIPADPAASASPGEASAALPQTGDVVVDGQPVGTFMIVDAGDGTGVALWSNGTTVFRVTAPVEHVRDVYAAFPL